MAARNYNIFDEPIPVCLMTRSEMAKLNHKCKKYSTDNCTSDSDCELITCYNRTDDGNEESYKTCVGTEEHEHSNDSLCPSSGI